MEAGMKDTRGVAAALLMVLITRAHLSGIAYPFAQGLLLIPALVGLALLLLSPAGDAGQGRKWREWALILPWVLCIWSFAGICRRTREGGSRRVLHFF
jgi:hypothetical protein